LVEDNCTLAVGSARAQVLMQMSTSPAIRFIILNIIFLDYFLG